MLFYWNVRERWFINSLQPYVCVWNFRTIHGSYGNRVGSRLSYRPARLQRLAVSISWNRFLGSKKSSRIFFSGVIYPSDDVSPWTMRPIDDAFRWVPTLDRIITVENHISLPVSLKGIDRPFGRGVESRLIWSAMVHWRLGWFFYLILKGLHQKINKKPLDAA